MVNKMKKCGCCNKNLNEIEFYSYKNKLWNYCKKCESNRKKTQLTNFKKSCLNYKNTNKCNICGYDKCIASLDFHHRDKNEKDFNISHCKQLVINDKIKNELDKCDVICSNCHRELHYKELEPFILNKKYKELNLCTDCNKECSNNSKRCFDCNNKQKQKLSKIPSKKQLMSDVEYLKYNTCIARKYNVSDNTVKKWKKKYKI